MEKQKIFNVSPADKNGIFTKIALCWQDEGFVQWHNLLIPVDARLFDDDSIGTYCYFEDGNLLVNEELPKLKQNEYKAILKGQVVLRTFIDFD